MLEKYLEMTDKYSEMKFSIRYLFCGVLLGLFLFSLSFALSGCATMGEVSGSGEPVGSTGGNSVGGKGLPPAKGREPVYRHLSYRQKKLVEGAYKLLGYRGNRIVVRGRSFNFDCSGTILAIYYYAGIDLTREFSRYTGNGVLRLYKILYYAHLLYLTKTPRPGDLIFWDNTYDRNHNGKMDDYLTHIGMVVNVYSDGTIEYVHEHIRKGIVIERMNLRYPNTYRKRINGRFVIINAPIRIKEKGKPHPSKWLASQLLRAFGKGYLYR